MASMLSEDSVDNFSDYSQFSVAWDDNLSEKSENIDTPTPQTEKTTNLVHNVINRQLYGRFAKNSKAKTERIFSNIHTKCRFALSSLIKDPDSFNHIFMGFTMCGQYFVSYTEKLCEEFPFSLNNSYEYELYIWRFVPGQKLEFISKHQIFKHLKGLRILDDVKFMQFPRDLYKLICYGFNSTNPDLIHITLLTLPTPKNCRHCSNSFSHTDESINQGWCIKHGFIVHYIFSMSQPTPIFDPNISLAYPNHLVINTGHHIHILNVSTSEPHPLTLTELSLSKDEDKSLINTPTHTFNDTLSEVSETPSEHFGSTSVVDAILEDFNEYDLESAECNKPFHELNISCEPLNVTGKSYHNTLVQNIVDPRVKRLQTSSKEYFFSVPQSSGAQKTLEKTKIDKKIAEKAYEFIEENEKYEKISSFRKKRLAEKKYEFSEDNSENIVPFNSLRRERRYLYKSQSRCIRSPDFNSLFLSPRSSGLRSPMQSPKSRSGQFSPSGARNLYCPSLRNSPHHSKSPISPRDNTRKFYVYSPSLDSDCSDSDSRLIMRTSSIIHGENKFNSGLLIVDPKIEKPKWIKKVVRRYSNGDFENSSLLSGQSRDDYNIPIEIPLLVQNLTDQHLDMVPDFKLEQSTEIQLIVTQRSFDCEQFVQHRAQKLCSEAELEFMHCEDYDIRIIHICPINGHIICHAIIKIGARRNPQCRLDKLEHFSANFLFTWSIENDAFGVIDNKGPCKLLPADEPVDIPNYDIPKCDEVLVMDYSYRSSKKTLRDYNNYFEICLESTNMAIRSHILIIEGYSSDSASE